LQLDVKRLFEIRDLVDGYMRNLDGDAAVAAPSAELLGNLWANWLSGLRGSQCIGFKARAEANAREGSRIEQGNFNL